MIIKRDVVFAILFARYGDVVVLYGANNVAMQASCCKHVMNTTETIEIMNITK